MPESGGPLPPSTRTRPFLLLGSDSEVIGLVRALQLVGVPTAMAADEAILEYWVERIASSRTKSASVGRSK